MSTPGVGQISIRWEIPIENVDGYHIYLDPPPPPSANIMLPITLGVFFSMTTISGLANSVTYNVSIASYNSGGDGPLTSLTIQTQAGRKIYYNAL